MSATSPDHYRGRFGCECIHVTMHMSFLAGNAYKYVWRHAEKGGVEDLEKAVVYVRWAARIDAPVWVSDAGRDAGTAMHGAFVAPTVDGVYVALRRIAGGQYAEAADLLRREIERRTP